MANQKLKIGYPAPGSNLLFLESGLYTLTGRDTLLTYNPGSGGGNTFTPTHYVSATATGTGNGTSGQPYTLAQACSLAQPGWRVLVRPGTYVGPNTNDRFTGSFRITTAGTQANPIIFFAENYASLSTTGRSILEHTGTPPGTIGNGCPVISLSGGHQWWGFYINEDDAPTHPDTGPVTVTGQYNRISYCRISRGQFSWPVVENNHGAIRFEWGGTRNNVVSDNWIENYSGIGANGSEQGIQFYGAEVGSTDHVGGTIIENNFFDNCQYAVTVKSINGRLIQGGLIIRRNIIAPSNYSVGGQLQSGGVNFIGVGDALGRSQVYQNIQVGGANLVMMSVQIYPNTNVDIVNNSAVNLQNADEQVGVLCTRPCAACTGVGWRLHNNIKTGPALFRKFRYDTDDAALQSSSHNISNGHASGWWAEHSDVPGFGTAVRTLAQWQASSIWDDNSSTTNPNFVSSTLGNANLARLSPGSVGIGFGLDILNLQGLGTSAPIDAGAYGGSPVIGIRPL